MRLRPRDQDGQKTNHGGWHFETSTSKMIYRGVDRVDQVKRSGLGDRAVEGDGDMCQDHGGGVEDMLLQAVW